MKNYLIIPLFLMLFSCIDDTEQVTSINLTVTQELFGKAMLDMGLITLTDLDDPDYIPDRVNILSRSSAREQLFTKMIPKGIPFLFIIQNRDRYTRLRIDLDRTGQRPLSLLSIPEVGTDINILIFDHGDKELTSQLEQAIRQGLLPFSNIVIRRMNY